jgi:hypothetical protein
MTGFIISNVIAQCSGKKQKAEAPTFLKRLGDCEVYQGMTARFTACVSGFPEPEVEWYRDNLRIFPSERIHFEREGSGLLRLIIEKVRYTKRHQIILQMLLK